jgi:Zn-dependent peptidase ImmA (M78 family)
MHRDRPIKGIYLDGSVRPSHEREADYFAACFLVPGKMLTKSFKKRFREKPLILDDTVAFWLNPSDPDSLLRADIGSLDFALAVASASSYGGAHFMSLASQFGVSPTTMAIRLLELELIEE